MTIFAQMVMGHLLGDFVLQPRWMSDLKTRQGTQGWLVCALHTLVYTFSVAAFMHVWTPGILLAIAVPHFIVDRWAIALVHLRMLDSNGRPGVIRASRIWQDPYIAIKFTAIDLAIHLMMLFGVAKLYTNGLL